MKVRARTMAAAVFTALLCAGFAVVTSSNDNASAAASPTFEFQAVACPTVSLCLAVGTALDNGAGYVNPYTTQLVSFKPGSSGKLTPEALVTGTLVRGMACPSSSRCVGVGEVLSRSKETGTGTAEAVVFDPDSPDRAKQISLDGATTSASGVACPSSSQCTALVAQGVGVVSEVVTFNPATGAVRDPFKLPSSQPSDISCPSTSQCTTVGGPAVTFDPISGTVNAAGAVYLTSRPNPNHATVEPATEPAQYRSVDCPSSTQCTASGIYGTDEAGPQSSVEATFDPTTETVNAAGEKTLATGDNAGGRGVSCPSASQCTLFFRGTPLSEQTFDPATGPVASSPPAEIDADNGYDTCPSMSRCVLVSAFGPISTFVGASGKITGTLVLDKKAAAQVPKLEQALKNCKKISNRKKRAACVKRADQRYG
jgi:hypothetical protein